MKRPFLLVVGLTVCACRSERSSEDDSEYAKTSTTAAQQSARASEASAPYRGAADAGLSARDRDFLAKAAQRGLFEVESSRLALARSRSDDVRKFAQRMVEDHGRLNAELQELVQEKSAALPDLLDEKRRKDLDELRGLDGETFDLRYCELQHSDHEDALALFERAARDADDPEVRAFAARTLPLLREHGKLF
jgi:putative membrane protein